MARSAKMGGKRRSATKTRKASPVKVRNPKPRPQKNQTVDPQQLIAMLRRELDQSRGELAARNSDYSERIAYQAATNDVLKVMSESPGDPQPVFNLISVRARDLCNAYGVTVYEFDGSLVHWRAATGVSDDPAVREAARAAFPLPPTPDLVVGRAILNRASVHIRDYDAEPRLRRFSTTVKSTVAVPLLRGGVPIGALQMGSRERGGFSDAQVGLLQTFADQAVIAIENARLFNETQQALERQTATADILKVIARSPDDVQPVFDAIAERANKLVGGHSTTVFRITGDMTELAALTSVSEEADTVLKAAFPIPIPGNPQLELVRQGQIAEITDAESAIYSDDLTIRNIARARGFRSRLLVPLKSDSGVIGGISVTRVEPGSFADQHVQLLQTFADQAVIAIENTRLFNETKEALERQTAISDILEVINRSPGKLTPVFDTILEKATLLCQASFGVLSMYAGDDLHQVVAMRNVPPAIANLFAEPVRLGAETGLGRLVRGESFVHISDAADDEGYRQGNPVRRALVDVAGTRTYLAIPLLKDGGFVGAFTIYRREIRLFNDKQIALLQSFAAQAVIAIENARLLNEVQAKTRDLEEALRYQTGSANILNVIASSPTDVQPVLKAIVESACELCEAYDAAVVLRDGEDLRFSAHHGPIPIGLEKWPINRRWTAGRAFLDRKPVHIEDLRDEKHSDFSDGRELALRMGHRSILSVPLLREGESIGAIVLRRTEVNPFSDKQIALLQTFADQAVIALGNVRLFEEVQARTRDLQESLQQQTATSEVLQVISASPGELGPVFDTMLLNAMQLCQASHSAIWLREGEGFRAAVLRGAWPEAFAEQWRSGTPVRLVDDAPIMRAALTGKPVQIEDLRDSPAYRSGDTLPVAAVEAGIRTIIWVPMFKDEECIGSFGLSRSEVRPFTEKQIELVGNFAKQGVIAIENARLLNELRARTQELSQSLDDLRTAQDRLVQTEKLASLGQLTAGIAHEIKNPLNFVNNFSALSVELTDELREILGQADLAEKLRTEVGELTGLLKSNLDKVVQHGKRADSIVKNMLLHSREGSGERRSAEVNRLVEESLSLAYHGARAEKAGFNITLKHDFDPDTGPLDLYPQEMTRALLNLISNGFYAATKRKAETSNDEAFEPVLSAATRNLVEMVEIRIRDNGTGIPPEVQEKMFNPFFTTKPTGEGTGLGLSMTHDIVVKQHGGRIDVETEPGEFTEFIITLPRGKGPAAKAE